jgi:ferredoxin
METYFLRNEDILKFYDRIAQDHRLYIPVRVKSLLKPKCDYGFNLPSDDYVAKEYSEVNKEDVAFNEYRCVEPARTFFTYYKEEVCEYFTEEEAKKRREKPLAVAGLKNCDLFSLKIQDHVFLEGADADPLYQARRENNLIISSDCPNFKEACFCRAFDINPHCTEHFDFNLSPITNGFLVDIGSRKAQEVFRSIKEIFTPATFGQLSGRASKRESAVKRLEEHLSHHKIPKKETLQEIVLAGFNSGVWTEQMKTCVECNGCVFMCDTCHCFLLADEPAGERTKRVRVWDGCLMKNFTRVAGGANPLKLRYQRLRNRYLKKFDFFISNLGYQACCGCGRCIDVCPGRIDIRYILRRLYEEKHLPADTG